MVMNEKHVFGYTCVSSIIVIFILIYSSSPKLIKIANDSVLPETIKDVKIEPKEYSPHVQNLVLFIVEGFEVEDFKDSNLPYITKLIENGTGCFTNYKLQPFSTTTQKIKTLITGSATGFLNNILSVNDQAQTENSIFQSAVNKKGLKIFFHSLNTNLKLFSNYGRIDQSGIVEYSLNRQINIKKDWLVFHFQASKISGDPSHSMEIVKSNNLRYLDDFVKSLHGAFSDYRKYKILIIGQSGSRLLTNDLVKNHHLGPLVTIQYENCNSENFQKYLEEFDITPMISLWTGLPIPFSSYGTIHLNFFSDFTLSEKIYISYYNTRKLFYDLMNLKAEKYIDSFIPIFQKTVTDHQEYLHNGEKYINAGQRILGIYEDLMNSFSKIIHDFRMQQNASIQFLAFILLIEALVIIQNTSCANSKSLKNFLCPSGIHVVLVVFVLLLGTLRNVTSFISLSKGDALVLAIIGFIMICNTLILATQRSFLSVFFSALFTKAKKSKETLRTLSSIIELPAEMKKNSILKVLLLGTILQLISLLDINFIKWERNVWFFLWSCLCVWIIINKLKIMYQYGFSTDQNDGEKFKNCQSELSIIASLVIMHRIILCYTQIGHWLEYSHNCASLCLFFGLMILAFVCKIYYEPFSNKWEEVTISLYLVFTICAVYALKVAEGKATFYFFSISSTGENEMILFWSGYCFGFIHGLVVSTVKTCFGKKSSANKLIASVIACCTMFMAMQNSVPNVILISMQVLYSLTLVDVLKEHKSSLILLHVWLGHLFYNYQQIYVVNADEIQEVTDNLFSLDFNLIIDGLIFIVNKFSPKFLAYFLCIYGQLNCNLRFSESVLRINKTFMSCQLMIIIAYSLGIMFRSPTEWSWTFLYLKLLYEVIYIILLILISLGIQTVANLHDIIVTPSLPADIV